MGVNLGDSVKFKATIKDENGVLFDPDSQNIVLKDPRKTSRSTTTNPTHLSLGVFEAAFIIPTSGPDGVWQIEWMTITGGEPEKERFYFTVEP